jgi:hypothetical protein
VAVEKKVRKEVERTVTREELAREKIARQAEKKIESIKNARNRVAQSQN